MNNNWTIDLIKQKVKTLKDNVVYRIADAIKFQKNHKVVKELLQNPIYKDTLLYQFHSQNDKDFYKILEKNKSKIGNYYNDNYILVHLRTGDDLRSRGIGRNSEPILKALKNYEKSKKIIIVTAMHYGHHRTDTSLYSGKTYIYNDDNYQQNIKLIHEFIQKLEHPVEDIMSNEDVDIDLLHLVFCKNLVASPNSGGFAKNIIQWHKKYLEK